MPAATHLHEWISVCLVARGWNLVEKNVASYGIYPTATITYKESLGGLYRKAL